MKEEKDFEFYENKAPNLEEGQKFFDTSFSHENEKTIFGESKEWTEEKKEKFKLEHGYKKDEKIKWTRIFSNEKIPYNENEDGKLDLIQGELGDCCSIAFIHCLKREMKDDVFASIFSTCKPIEGYFEVLFYFEEEDKTITRKRVFVDDFIPYKKIPRNFKNLCDIPEFIPIFSRYEEFDNFMVGKYLLIEKAYAKIEGSYMDIEGKDISFHLTGVKSEEKYLVEIMKEKILRRDKDNKIKNELEKQLLTELYKDELNKILLDDLRESQKHKEEKKEHIKNLENYFENLKKFYTKNIISKNQYLNYSDKYEIFNEIKNESDINLVRINSENSLLVGPITHFGIFGNHRYDYIKGIKHDENLFFHIWNPHGKNPKINNDYEFKDINKINSDGINNGDIVLSFDKFIVTFEKIVYQNKKEIKKMYDKFKTKDSFDSLGVINTHLFLKMFGCRLDFWLTILWLRIYHSKEKDNKTIFYDLMKELDSTKKINMEQLIWFLYIWNILKKEIIKESEDIMSKKLNNICEIDLEKIKDILYEENEKTNIYLIHIAKSQDSFIKEKLTQLREELEPFIKTLIEKYSEEKKRKEREEEERKRRQREEEEEEERRRRRQREEEEEEERRRRRQREEEERRRRQREEEKRRRESRQYEIRVKFCNKNLDGVSLSRNDHVHIWDVHHGNNQKFRKIENNDGSVSFVNGDKAIDVRGAIVKNGNAIQIFDRNKTGAQKFYLKDRGNGWVSIHSALNQRFCLDVNNFGSGNGTKVILWEFKERDNDNQLFKLI